MLRSLSTWTVLSAATLIFVGALGCNPTTMNPTSNSVKDAADRAAENTRDNASAEAERVRNQYDNAADNVRNQTGKDWTGSSQIPSVEKKADILENEGDRKAREIKEQGEKKAEQIELKGEIKAENPRPR